MAGPLILGVPIYWWIAGMVGGGVAVGAAQGGKEMGRELGEEAGKGTGNGAMIFATLAGSALVYEAYRRAK